MAEPEKEILRCIDSYYNVKQAIKVGQMVKFSEASKTREGRVVEKYEYHFLVKYGRLRQCFTYVDVMLGSVQPVDAHYSR